MAISKRKLNTPMTVNATSAKTLDRSFLEYIVDGPTGPAPNKVLYRIVSTPSVGTLQRGAQVLRVGDTFTQQEINTSSIVYVSDPSNKTVVLVDMRIRVYEDGSPSQGEEIKFVFRYSLPDVAPEGVVGELKVNEWKEAKILAAQIKFEDLYDSANAVFIVIQSWPRHGTLFFDGKIIGPSSKQNISQADISAGRLSYKHTPLPGNEEIEEDVIEFKVRDAKMKWTGTNLSSQSEVNASVFRLPVLIGVFDLPIEWVRDSGSVFQCDTLVFNDDNFDLADPDVDDAARAITYKLDILPTSGILYFNNYPAPVGLTFNQADIRAGKLKYEQDCSDNKEDLFYITASHDKTTTTGLEYRVKLVPNRAPVVTGATISVRKCETVTIEGKHISLHDNEGQEANLTMGFAKVSETTPAPKHGKLMFNGTIAVPGTTTFKLADVAAGKFQYVHNCTTHEPATDELFFYVLDGSHRVEFSIKINIIYPINNPPYIVENIVHEVSRKVDYTFDRRQLDFADDDSPSSEVFLEFVELPEHGTLTIDGVDVVVGMVISRSDWENARINYNTGVNGAPMTVTRDSAAFKLKDEDNETSKIPLTFKFPEVTSCPRVTNLLVKVPLNARRVITEVEVFADNEGFRDSDMVWTITRIPEYGDVFVGDKRLVSHSDTSTWTSRDIKDMKFAYQHKQGLPQTDSMDFTVTNGYCAVSGTITFDYAPGLIIRRSGVLMVTQEVGGLAEIINETTLHSTSGNVGSNRQIEYTITQLPQNGKLFIDGVHILNTSAVVFTQDDLYMSRVAYLVNDDIGENVVDDFFKFRVNDPYETREGVYEIMITPIDRPPEVTVTGITVGEERCATILHVEHILVKDKVSKPNGLAIHILELPQHGIIRKGGTAMLAGQSFTVADLQTGKIAYCEETVGATMDSFDFEVRDDGGNVVGPLTFPITITPPPPMEVYVGNLTIEPCTTKVFRRRDIDIKNTRATYDISEMIFTLKSPPEKGVLSLNGNELSIDGTFTLQDLEDGNLTYVGASLSKDNDSFGFDVLSETDFNEFSAVGQVYTITFKTVFNPPWVCRLSTLELMELETAVISFDHLQMCDIERGRSSAYVRPPAAVGSVISPAYTDDNGIARNTAPLPPAPAGRTMGFVFKVLSGSAKFTVKDQNGTMIYSGQCLQHGNEEHVGPIDVASHVSSFEVEVQDGCLPSFSGKANWEFSHTDFILPVPEEDEDMDLIPNPPAEDPQ